MTDFRSQTLIIVGAGSYQVPIFERAREQGLFTISIDRSSSAPGSLIADLALAVSAHEPEAAFDAVESVAEEVPQIIGVIAGGARRCTLTASYLAEKLALPGVSLAAARIVSEKSLMRECARDGGFFTLPFMETDSYDEIVSQWREYPCVLKPLGTSGGQGMMFVEDSSLMEAAWEKCREAQPQGRLLVEGFAEGRNIHVCGLVDGSDFFFLGAIEAFPRGRAGPLLGYVAPVSLSKEEGLSLVQQTDELIRFFEISSGLVTADWVMDRERGPQLIEMEANVPGSFIAEYAIPLSTGRSPIDGAICSALGQDVGEFRKTSLENTETKGVAVVFDDHGQTDEWESESKNLLETSYGKASLFLGSLEQKEAWAQKLCKISDG